MHTNQVLHQGALEMPSLKAGVLPFVLGNALLDTIGVFVHQSQADPLTVTWFRCAFGLVGLTLWMAWRRKLPALRLSRATAPWVLLASVLTWFGLQG